MFLLVIEVTDKFFWIIMDAMDPHQHKSIWNWQEQDQVSWKDIQAFQIFEGERQEGS
jgi:hypothetical protein